MFQIESLDLVKNGLTVQELMWQNKIKGRIVQKHSVNGIGKFRAEILMETAEGDYKEGNVDGIKSGTSDPSGSEKLSGAVQNMVRGSERHLFHGEIRTTRCCFGRFRDFP